MALYISVYLEFFLFYSLQLNKSLEEEEKKPDRHMFLEQLIPVFMILFFIIWIYIFITDGIPEIKSISNEICSDEPQEVD